MTQKTRLDSRRQAAQNQPQCGKTDAAVKDRIERVLPYTLGRCLPSVRSDLRALKRQLQKNERRSGRRLNDTARQAERKVRRLDAARDSRARRLKLRARRDAVSRSQAARMLALGCRSPRRRWI
jgi:predicted secreted Zn-dependent protease